MFFTVARLRLLTFFLALLFSLVSAREDTLFTSSVTYCEPPETLLVEQFEIAYFASNSSVSFNISAASVEANVNVSANIMLNFYGLHPFNFTIDLCNILHGALCPLPMYNFTGSDSIPLPSSLGISSKIPGIVYKIPDLEAFAQLTLVEVGTGNVKACVQATLSNGWSTHQVGVEWATGAVALLALLSSILHSFSPEALAPHRFLDLFHLFQTIAISGFLDLNYPSVYRAFSLNFAWAMGLFSSTHVQNSINNMRRLTGGNMADVTSGSAVGLVNRKLSPYNTIGLSSSPQIFSTLGASNISSFTRLSSFGSASPKNFTNLQAVATVTSASSNVLQAGIPIYVNSLRIATGNAFMTVFLTVMMLAAIVLAFLGLLYFALVLATRSGKGRQDRIAEAKFGYVSFAKAWYLRFCIVALTPILIFTFYQWTLKDSWLSILLSVLMLIAIVASVIYPVFLTVRIALRSTAYSLYTQPEHLAAYGPLYAQYRTPRYYSFLPLLIASFLKSLFIAFAKDTGEVQIILILIVDFFVLLAQIALKPHKTRGGDVLSTYLSVVRLVVSGLMIAFLEKLSLSAIIRVIIGCIIAVIFSVTVVILFVNTLVNLRLHRMWSRRSSRSAAPLGSVESSLREKSEDAERATISVESQLQRGRPINPTPDRNIPLDPEINHPYPEETPSPTTIEHQSMYTRESTSTNLGSVIPGRWSFLHPHSRTNSHSHSPESESPHSPYFTSSPSSPRHSARASRQPTVEEHPQLT